MEKFYFALLLLCSAYFSLPAQDGSIDPDFGTDGFGIIDLDCGLCFSQAMVLQEDQKLVVAGRRVTQAGQHVTVVRFLENGLPDPDFGTGGGVYSPVEFASYAHDVALQADGKIVVVGKTKVNDIEHFLIIRYEADGSLDSTFGEMGIMKISVLGVDAVAREVEIQPDGKILVAGVVYYSGIDNPDADAAYITMRFLENGELDPSFGTGGEVITDVVLGVFAGRPEALNAMELYADGKILLAGHAGVESVLIRYEANGDLDVDFGAEGIVKTRFLPISVIKLQDAIVQPDGHIVVTGRNFEFPVSTLFARYDAQGNLDPGFGTDGAVLMNFGDTILLTPGGLKLQSDNKILMAGSILDQGSRFCVMRLNPDGQVDASFGDHGRVTAQYGTGTNHFSELVLQDGEQIVAGGYGYKDGNADFVAMRFKNGNSTIIEDPILCGSHVFPNPFDEELNIHYCLDSDALVSIALYGSDGKLAKQLQYKAARTAGQNQETFPVGNLAVGAYYLVVSVPNSSPLSDPIIFSSLVIKR